MLATAGVNYLNGFLMMIAFVFVVGNVEEVLQTKTGQPWVQVLWNVTQSRAATMVMTAFVIFFFIFAAINSGLTASRQLFAFARDGGVPFSKFIGYVSTNFATIPVMYSLFPRSLPTGTSL
jgi:amino acid permease